MTVLISASELQSVLVGPSVPVVLDVRYPGPGVVGNGFEEFAKAHVPGSQWVDLDTQLAAPPGGPGGRHPLPGVDRLEAAMRRTGVDADRQVVVLDGGNSLAAARLWWLLRHHGHRAVRVLDGGFAAWQRSGGPLETGPPVPVQPGNFTALPGVLPVVSADELEAVLAEGEARVWDVRTPERFRGAAEPIDPVAGHIPGAQNLPAVDQHEADGRFRSAAELQNLFAEVRPGDVVYCGSGITAAQALLAMEVAGVGAGVRLYPGSWSDWIHSGARPVARG